MIGVDVSLLAYGVNRHTPEHARAARVLEGLAQGDRPWGLPWSAAHEFMRFVTHRHAVARALRPADAWAFLEALMASPAVRMLGPTAAHAEAARDVLAFLEAEPGPLPEGFETAVILKEHGIRELLSLDHGMRRFAFLDVRDPVHGETWNASAPPARRYRRLSPR